MNKRIKKKHIVKENKTLMQDTLRQLKAMGLHPFNITYPGGYFVFHNHAPYEIMHFQLKERPEFLFAIWYKEFELDNPTRVVKLPVIFGERLYLLDKFKPSRAEWSPLYDEFIQNDMEITFSDYWATVQSLPDFIKAPWEHIYNETEEDYNELFEDERLKKEYTQKILQTLRPEVEKRFKEIGIPLGILTPNFYFAYQDFYLIFNETDSQEQIENKLSKIDDFISFDLKNLVKDIIASLNCDDHVSIYQDEFKWRQTHYWTNTIETIEKAKTMSIMDLNKAFDDMNLKRSDILRIIGE